MSGHGRWVTAAVTLALGAGLLGGPTASGEDRQRAGQVGFLPHRAARGGTVRVLLYSDLEHLDPQRVYVGRDGANLGRLVYRSLVAFPASTDRGRAAAPVPDLATDTGTSNADSTRWSFTLKDGVRWQDGRPITCQDLKYGASRTFATDVITGGATYLLAYLDIPADADGRPIYRGPYVRDPRGEAAFDKAITCAGATVTYRFKKPWRDFPLAVASLTAFDPFRADRDRGGASDRSIFSDGPYRLRARAGDDGDGFTLVRNSRWDPATDPIRQANPDRFVFESGLEPETQYAALVADRRPNAIPTASAPPSYFRQVRTRAAQRSVSLDSPYSSYLVPNFNSPLMKRPRARRALALATDRRSYSRTLGGPRAARAAYSIVNPAVPGYRRNPAFAPIPLAGRPRRARWLLRAAGLQLPVRLTYTYPGGTPTAERAANDLAEGWDRAGFETRLVSLDESYYAQIRDPHFPTDVVLGGWGADWPSIGAVIPPLFDSRINLSPGSNGQDFGNYRSAKVDRAIDAANRLLDPGRAAEAYARIDAQLGRDTAYVPLTLTRFYFLRGSHIRGYTTPVTTSGYPDLALISLKQE